ncbi:MAG: hypothetical protein ACT452_10845 [Microthrixaceae bacterium]
MRTRTIALIAVIGLIAMVNPANADLHQGVPVPLVDLPVNPGFASPNVDYVGTIPLDSPGVGAHLRTDDQGRRLMYVSGVPGLSIYDLSSPAEPLLLSHLPMPNWENEDITVSADGKTALMTEFMNIFYVHVIDVSDPTLPVLKSTVPFRAAGHIADCMDPACDVVWGSDGEILDLRDKANPVFLSTTWTSQLFVGPGHNVNIDAAGYAMTDTRPMVFADISNPLAPRRIATSSTAQHGTYKTAYQHNNLRPRADEYIERSEAEGTNYPLRPGELVLGNGETNFSGVCNSGSGPFATWKAVNVTKGTMMTVADVLRPVSGSYTNGDPAVNELGCSGHWFTSRTEGNDQIVAGAWYEHGTRILKVDGATGVISQLGWWQPGVGSASAAHWIDDEYIYTIDYQRGIDILKFSPSPDLIPSVEAIDQSWLANLSAVNPLAEGERQFCRLASSGDPALTARPVGALSAALVP